MSRVLSANPKRKSDAATWHARVFKAHGKFCYFCGGHANEAMHIIPRQMLGSLRYEIPEENGRPGCHACHGKHGRMLDFKRADIERAIEAHNAISKVKLRMPV
jgi:hypothetical protein